MSVYIGTEFSDLLDDSTRLVVNIAGETITAEQLDVGLAEALERDGNYFAMDDIAPHIFFVRDDGWILGASPTFEEVAYEMWKDEWVGFVKCPNDLVEDIANYDPEEGELEDYDTEHEGI